MSQRSIHCRLSNSMRRLPENATRSLVERFAALSNKWSYSVSSRVFNFAAARGRIDLVPETKPISRSGAKNDGALPRGTCSEQIRLGRVHPKWGDLLWTFLSWKIEQHRPFGDQQLLGANRHQVSHIGYLTRRTPKRAQI